MRSHELDLNLLVVLRALLSERNVTHAASALGVSQPTVSAALRRLREHYKDELLVRDRGAYFLTPLGEQLFRRIHEALELAERVFEQPSSFDASNSTRRFTIAMSAYACAMLGDAIAREASAQAPHVTIEYRQIPEGPVSDVVRRQHGDVDLWIAQGRQTPHQPATALLTDRLVCVASSTNGRIGKRPSDADLKGLRWAISPVDRDRHPFGQTSFDGVELHSAIEVDSYLALALIAATSDLVAVLPLRLARLLEATIGLRVLPTQVPGGLTLVMYPNGARIQQCDDAWLKSVVRVACGLDERGASPPTHSP